MTSTTKPPPTELKAAAEALDAALLRREAEWPERGPAWHTLNGALERFADVVLAGLGPTPDPEPATGGPLTDAPIIVGGPMKSGTTLLTELLDGHPGLVVLPGDTWMRRWFGAGDPAPDTPDGAVRFWLRRLIVPTGQAPFWLLGSDANEYLRFARRVRSIAAQGRADGLATFLAGPIALAETCARTTDARFVEKTPENERSVPAFLHAYPRATFVHMLRQPLSVSAAVKRLAAHRGWDWDGAAFGRALAESYRLASRWEAELGPGRYLIVRYESLTADPEAQTRALALALGLGFDPLLLTPTTLGRPATSNSMFSHRRAAGQMVRDEHPEHRWRQVLSREEIEAVSNAARSAAAPFGYEL